MKVNKEQLKKWQEEAAQEYYESWYKKICKSVIHNENIVARLKTKDGSDAIGSDNVELKIAEAKRQLDYEEADLKWLSGLLLKDK